MSRSPEGGGVSVLTPSRSRQMVPFLCRSPPRVWDGAAWSRARSLQAAAPHHLEARHPCQVWPRRVAKLSPGATTRDPSPPRTTGKPGKSLAGEGKRQGSEGRSHGERPRGTAAPAAPVPCRPARPPPLLRDPPSGGAAARRGLRGAGRGWPRLRRRAGSERARGAGAGRSGRRRRARRAGRARGAAARPA